MKTTNVVTKASEAYRLAEAARQELKRVALVPTMGALHVGHLSLVDIAKAKSDFQVVTIFVNPTQFSPGEDYDRYPRALEKDREKLVTREVDLIFAPTRGEMYPKGYGTSVTVDRLTDGLCGKSRPGHFTGVATVVTKLFNIIGPCMAVFGRKDYQQLQVIKKLVRDLNLRVEIAEAPIVREPDGLAMSSRNAYLSEEERVRARSISRGLKAAYDLFEGGERSVGRLLEVVAGPLEKAADELDYVTGADPQTLAPLKSEQRAQETLLIAVAAKFGTTRLIDNTVLGEDKPPF